MCKTSVDQVTKGMLTLDDDCIVENVYFLKDVYRYYLYVFIS